MNKNVMKSIVIVLVVALIILACGIQTISEPTIPLPSSTSQIFSPTQAPTSTNEPPHEIYAGFTDNSEIPFIMIHQSGESLGVIQDPNSSKVTGVVWNSADGKSIVIYTDSNGMPQSAVAGDDIISYSNYTANTVDVTVTHADGTQEAFQAQLDTDLLNKITSFSAPSFNLVSYHRSQSPQQLDKWFYIKTGLYIAGAANCISKVPGSAVVPIIGIPLLAQACAGFLLGTVIRVGNALNLDVGGLEAAKNTWDVLNCYAPASLDVVARALACANAMATEFEKQDKAAKQKIANPPPSPTPLSTNMPIPTDTPQPITSLRGTVLQLSNCRYGPDWPYLYKYGVGVGTKMEVIGRDADGNWLQVQGIGGHNACWIKGVQIQVDGDVMALPDTYPNTTGLPISPFFPEISISVSYSGGMVNVSWPDHEIRSDLGTEQGIEYVVEIWTCVDGKPTFYALGLPPGETNASFEIDNSCGMVSHADVIGEDKEGFSPPAIITLP